MTHQPDYRSELKRARGLGPSHEGTGHFWLQRVSALALVPLSIWFLVKLVTILATADRAHVAQWFHDPVTALFMAVFMGAMFLHARIGMQEIVEDYVHCKAAKLTVLLFGKGLNLLLCLATLAAIARLHFIGI